MTLKKLGISSIVQYPKFFIGEIIRGLGYSITKRPKEATMLINVFNTSYEKNVLFSYIRSVFEDDKNRKDNRHTNRLTSHIMAEILSELGYNVDVVNYNDDFKGNFDKYNLVIGLGKSLDHVLSSRNADSRTKVIWFGTGCNPLFSNTITIERVADFYKRHHKLIMASSRYIKEDWVLQHEFADWIILHGSTFAKSTYRKDNISTIHAPVFINQSVDRNEEEWGKAIQNYLWFGSDGAIHKGLDLVLDAFRELKECNLHICGNIEPEFLNYYSSLINASNNINTMALLILSQIPLRRYCTIAHL
jgi:glycosyltransferase involved in cell wall biosynthesis